MRNKKGLSAIVATLIIILLTLVAVGIVWVVIRNVIQGGADSVDLSSKCLAVSLSANSVTETSLGVYDVTLHRSAGGDDLGGVKVVVFNATSNSGVMDFGTLTALQTRTVSVNTNTVPATLVTAGDSLEFTPFFLDSSGSEQLCPQSTQTFEF